MNRAFCLGKRAVVFTACVLVGACQPRPASEPPKTVNAEPSGEERDNPEAATAATALAVAVTAATLPHEATPIATVPPPPKPEAPKPPRPKLQVLVSETAADDPAKQLLIGYERLGKSKKSEHIDLNTDRNAVEFPASVTSAKLRGVKVAASEGAGRARALEVEFNLQDQRAEFAGCSAKAACGCEGAIPYAYVSLSQQLPTDAHLDQFPSLSFWARSPESYQLHIILSCFVEPRPLDTLAPSNGYLDEAHTQIDPCWHAQRVELPLSDPIDIRGDNVWHRYQFRIADVPPSEPVTLMGGGLMVCSLDKVNHVVYVLKKSHPPQLGEYPKDQGIVQFDNLERLTK